jgi:cytochrome c oxidase subunit 1
MPRRYHVYADGFQVLNVMSTAGATILGVGYLLPLLYLGWSWFRGPRAPANPWKATGLEWTATDSPPIQHNFKTPPTVDRPPYDYHTPGSDEAAKLFEADAQEDEP